MSALARAWLRYACVGAAAAALIGGVADPQREVSSQVQPMLRVVATGAVPAAVWQAIEARAGATTWVEASSDPGELAVALHARDAAPALLWVQPIAGDLVPASGSAPAPVFTAVPPLDFEPAGVRVRLVGRAQVGRPLVLELFGLPAGWRGELRVENPDGSVLAAAPERERPASDSGVAARIEALPLTAGAHAVTLRVQQSEITLRATGAVTVAPAPLLLAVGEGAAPVAAALRAQGFTVEPADTWPDDLSRYDTLLLGRILTAAEQERVLAFVDDGGGAFLLGGEDGGALTTSTEPGAALSPVVLAARPVQGETAVPGAGTSEPPAAGKPPPGQTPPAPPDAKPEPPAVGDTSGTKAPVGGGQEVERRTVAMVFVIDRSHSMLEPVTPGGPTRMDFVRSSAQATASKLLEGDHVGVVTFGNRDSEEVVLPLTPATAFEAVHRAFAGLAARRLEGTYVDSALARAKLLLAPSRAAVKHVVVITDGLIEDLMLAIAQAAVLRSSGVTVSMIRFGASQEDLTASRLCRQFANSGGGAYLHSTDTAEVPALVSAEVKAVLARTGRVMRDDAQGDAPAPSAPTPPPPAPRVTQSLPAPAPVTPPAPTPAPRLPVHVVDESALLAGLPASGPPAVGGILAVSARPEARVLLAAGDQGRPLLAFKNYGLGRVGVWTSDLAGAWSQEWRAAAGFAGWLAQWVAALARPVADAGLADVLVAREVQPRGPTPAEVAALERFSGQAVHAVADVRAPAPRAATVRVGAGDLLAGVGALLLVLLAGLEFWTARRREPAPTVG